MIINKPMDMDDKEYIKFWKEKCLRYINVDGIGIIPFNDMFWLETEAVHRFCADYIGDYANKENFCGELVYNFDNSKYNFNIGAIWRFSMRMFANLALIPVVEVIKTETDNVFDALNNMNSNEIDHVELVYKTNGRMNHIQLKDRYLLSLMENVIRNESPSYITQERLKEKKMDKVVQFSIKYFDKMTFNMWLIDRLERLFADLLSEEKDLPDEIKLLILDILFLLGRLEYPHFKTDYYRKMKSLMNKEPEKYFPYTPNFILREGKVLPIFLVENRSAQKIRQEYFK